MYVIFEKSTGKVLGISPKKEVENCILVDLNEVKGLLTGRERRKDYRVEYNPKTKQLELKNLHLQSLDGFTVNDFIYEIPETVSEDPDITIEQNQKEKCWKIILGDSFKHWKIMLGGSLTSNTKNQGIHFNNKLSFSVTKKHDPNILYKTLVVDFSEILQDNCAVLPFTMPFEYKDAEISIFTSKRFGIYYFKRKLNE